MTSRFALCWFAMSIWCLGSATAQQQGTIAPTGDFTRDNAALRTTYVLGTSDVLFVRAGDVQEIDGKQYPVESDGFINFPLIGRVKAGGQTVEALETELVRQLKVLFVTPKVAVSIVQFRTEPIFFVGAFKAPGIHPLQDRRRLLEVLTVNGGLAANAGHRLKITRKAAYGEIPLPNVVVDKDRGISTAEVNINLLMEASSSDDNLMLQPFDVITAQRTEMVYVSGEVAKIGGFELTDREYLTVTQLLSLAGGVSKEGDASKARILRPVLDTNRRAELPVNIKEVLRGRASDFRLMPNDVLVVPSRNAVRRTASTMALFAAPGIISTLVLIAIR